jgi:hypothetical protein
MTAFLNAFAAEANWTGACRQAGISRNLPRVWEEHDTDGFVPRLAEARSKAEDVLRAEIHRRAITGISEVKETRELRGDRLVLVRTEARLVKSNGILMRLAEAWLPEFKRERDRTVAGDDDKIPLETLRGWIEDAEAADAEADE